jgi:hypothetical protein
METLHLSWALVDLLRTRGPQPALVVPDHARVPIPDGAGRGTAAVGDRTITHAELAELVAGAAQRLGRERRLVMIRASSELPTIVWYLAALAGRHPVLLASPTDDEAAARLATRYRPDVTIDRTPVDGEPTVGSGPSPHELHPRLALLMSTSGSTGSPKLVRLSRRNLLANARAIAHYLGLSPDDRAITTLPLHYCYGLSVLHSHLVAGASVVLNDASVIDPSFWDRFARSGCTSFAGVPHTFDLLDRIGFDTLELPTLRHVTQAGGRMEPEAVRRYARLGRERGWRFYAMYGQTEATARMAYLPPDRALAHPATIGVPVRNGSLRLAPLPEELAPPLGGETAPVDQGLPGTMAEAAQDHPIGQGELVYRGPNVMLGYASSPADLALGATVDELRTGDLARRAPDGSFEIIGRRQRFAKPFGTRVDLDDVESLLTADGLAVAVTGDDGRLVVACDPSQDSEVSRRAAAERAGVPVSAVEVVVVETVPRNDRGKVDYGAILAVAGGVDPTAEGAAPAQPTPDPSDGLGDVVALYRSVLGVDGVRPTDSFVSLGGDSLNYVKLSIALEDLLGRLPPDWPDRPVAELTGAETSRPWLRRTETTVVLRGLAIVLIVATHAGLTNLPAGAHVLLGVAGYNFARFQLRTGRWWPTIARIALPSMLWIGSLALLTGRYPLVSPLLVHNAVGSAAWSPAWRYWFIDVIVQTLMGAALLLSIPAVRRVERHRPFAFAAGLLVVAVFLRHDPLDLLLSSRDGGRTLTALWAFAIGWAAAQTRTATQRLAVTAAIPMAAVGYYANDLRVAMIMAALTALVWVPRVALPGPLVRVAGTVGAASLYIYLTHWEVYPRLVDAAGSLVATVGSIGVGVAAWVVIDRVGRSSDLSRRWR